MVDVSIIVPVHNEAEYLLPFYYDLNRKLPNNFELIWVNDGSTDSTLEEIGQLSYKDNRIKCITLSRPFGKAAAAMAGLDYAQGQYIIVMSGDLQHPASLIPDILKTLEGGADIVSTRPSNAAVILPFQRVILNGWYRFLELISAEKDMINIADFRGFHNRVVDDIRFIRQRNFFPGHFFNWNDYKRAELTYYNNRNDATHRRYSITHLYQRTVAAFKNCKPGLLKSFVVCGALLSATALALGCLTILRYLEGATVQPGMLLLNVLLLVSGIQLFVMSSYKRKLFRELLRFYKSHQYLVKEVMVQDNHLQEFSFMNRGKMGQV
ncbi:MAG TPA: glycosyltransferase family 2 protein [Lacibacter sp.]|nr:glycosyltransferase family 2 protein [Lacibacter sp.]HMO89502.1 glycosyltransferase family 2 protein [Lacibacter sp.]HMP87068.1 glycosyltransferase family 2 protein [Lacibacter sp.]